VEELFSSPRVQNGSGAHPASYPDHSLPSSAEFKSGWSYISIPQYTCMAWFSAEA